MNSHTAQKESRGRGCKEKKESHHATLEGRNLNLVFLKEKEGESESDDELAKFSTNISPHFFSTEKREISIKVFLKCLEARR